MAAMLRTKAGGAEATTPGGSWWSRARSRYEIEEYGYQLGRAWGIGAENADDGAILLVAPNERAVRVEVGYGLEGVLTDSLSSAVIQGQIIPAFKAGDLPAGIVAGADALIELLSLPEAEAQARAVAAGAQRQGPDEEGDLPMWLIILIIVVVIWLSTRGGGGRGRRRRRGGGLADVLVWSAVNAASNSGGRSGGWSSGGGGFGGGGFSGGGGSFGGGGASGRW
jgi:uncharacterized protein